MRAQLRDPFVRSLVVLAALAVAGFGAVIAAWESLADSLVPSTQFAFAVSGGLGGLALLGFALGLLTIQAGRRASARDRAQLARIGGLVADIGRRAGS